MGWATGMNRRHFGRAAAATASAFAFQVVPSRVFGANERVALGAIGTSGKGATDVAESAKVGFEIVALTDVADIRKNPEKKGNIGALATTRDAHPDAKFYLDYREMLHDLGDKVDAVTVSIPDHHHFHAARAALLAGKHVYCQKPLTHGIWEARTLAALAREKGVKTQMGNQGQAQDASRRCAEIIRAGAVGSIKEVHVWTDRPTWPQGFDAPPDPQPVPDWLDWEQWIGPAPFVEYHPKIAPFNWRGWWDYGTGALGDIACHYLAMVSTAIQPGPPRSVQAVATGGTELSPPITSTVTYEFANGLKYIWYDGQKGARFVRDTWSLVPGEFNRPGNEILHGLDHKRYDVAVVGETGILLFSYARPGEWVVVPSARLDGFAWPTPSLPRAREQNSYAEWQDAITGQIAEAESHFGNSGPFTEMILLGCLAQRFPGEKLEWDHDALEVKGRPELRKFIQREYRKGWEVTS
jgi:predicted dehydrogenase